MLAGAGEPLERVGDAVGALLATSAVANGLFSRSQWNLGISGGFASPLASELIAQADLVLAFGASLNAWTTAHGKLIGPQAVVIQVDLEPRAIGVHRKVDLGVLGDASETASALVSEMAARSLARKGWRSTELAERIRTHRWRDETYADRGDDEHIDPRTLSIALKWPCWKRPRMIGSEAKTKAIVAGNVRNKASSMPRFWVSIASRSRFWLSCRDTVGRRIVPSPMPISPSGSWFSRSA